MSDYLGIDTSNYTTSAAVLTEGGDIRQLRRLLPVKEGERGLRQSDALFHHTKILPELLEELLSEAELKAVGVSTRPRNIEGSYMPCFLAGEGAARAIAAAGKLPIYRTFSGGTTDCLLVTPDPDEVITCREITSSSDLKAGQAIDRVGVMLGLKFPCGAELEKLALRSAREFKVKASFKDGRCSLSGVENICRRMFEQGEDSRDIALCCIKHIEAAAAAMTEYAIKEVGRLPLVYAGGVMSDGIIREALQSRFDCCFAEPAFSADNACGTAVYAAVKDGFIK